MKKILILATTATLLFSCKKNDDKAGTFSGPEASIYQGKGKSWVKLDGNGSVQQLGVTIDDAAMNSLPTIGSGTEVTLALNLEAKTATPFDHIEVGWNPLGHEPSGIYDKPHFDFHFYTVPESEVKGATDNVKLNANPAADYLPQNYVPGPPVPQMGKHFIDVTSPELNGQPFTQTFLFGTYDAKVTFYEPMITLAFLKATTTFERSIPQSAKFKKAGYYPTKMSITKHDGVTDIILDGFVQRQAT